MASFMVSSRASSKRCSMLMLMWPYIFVPFIILLASNTASDETLPIIKKDSRGDPSTCIQCRLSKEEKGNEERQRKKKWWQTKS